MAEQIELTCDAIITRLNSGLSAKIDAINLTLTDEWTLDYPAGVTFGRRSDHAFPFIFVLPDHTDNTNDNGLRVHFNHTVLVTAMLACYDEEGLSRLAVRYQRAIREAVLGDRELSGVTAGAGYGIQHRRDDYGPTFTSQEGQFVTWARSRYTVQQQQDF